MALKQFNEDEIKQIIELFFKKIEYNNYNKTFVYSDNNPINYTINIINKDEFSSQLFNTLKENINYKEKLIYYYENKINLLFWIKDDELKTPIKEYSNILNTINKNITVSKDVAIKRPIYDQLIKKHITQCFIECSYIVHLISELCTTNNICNERKNIQNKIFDLIIKNNAILKYYEFGIELDSIYDIVRKKILNVMTDYNYNLNNQLTLIKIKENLLGKLYYHCKQQHSTDLNDETILLLNDRIDEFINKCKDVLSSKTNLNILNNILNNYTLKKTIIIYYLQIQIYHNTKTI